MSLWGLVLKLSHWTSFAHVAFGSVSIRDSPRSLSVRAERRVGNGDDSTGRSQTPQFEDNEI